MEDEVGEKNIYSLLFNNYLDFKIFIKNDNISGKTNINWKILRDINKWKVKLKYFYTNIYKENIENIKPKDITETN
jgi:uridine kinase